jgi:ribosomal protein S27E
MHMAQDSSHYLNELPIWKLKIVAAEYGIDVSACKYKRDFVDKVMGKKLSDDQVRTALSKAKNKPTEKQAPGENTSDVKAIGAEIKKISDRPGEPMELPQKDEKNFERHIDEALTMKPSFFEIDSTTENVLNRMIMGDFGEAIRINREARMRCLENFSAYQVYSAAVSIRAADELLSRLTDDGGRLSPTLRTAVAAAKRSFITGSPRQREEALENLETLAVKTYEAFTKESGQEEEELRVLLADYESFGARTEEARKFLEIAASARRSFNFEDYSKYITDARTRAEEAKVLRAKEIESAIPLVNAAAQEAKEIGVDTGSAESDIGEVRKALEMGAFKRATDLLAAIEQTVDAAHLEQIKRQRDLGTRQLEKAKDTVSNREPVVMEAASYGLDVQQQVRHIANAKYAIERKDAVNAVKYARVLKDGSTSIEKALDHKRIDAGIMTHVDDVKCGKCGNETLYTLPNAGQKCVECGHSFSLTPASNTATTPKPQRTLAQDHAAKRLAETPTPDAVQKEPQKTIPEKKKRGFFKW